MDALIQTKATTPPSSSTSSLDGASKNGQGDERKDHTNNGSASPTTVATMANEEHDDTTSIDPARAPPLLDDSPSSRMILSNLEPLHNHHPSNDGISKSRVNFLGGPINRDDDDDVTVKHVNGHMKLALAGKDAELATAFDSPNAFLHRVVDDKIQSVGSEPRSNGILPCSNESENQVQSVTFSKKQERAWALWAVLLNGSQRKRSLMTDLSTWIAVSLTLDGRDKLTKVLQYCSRLASWWLLGMAKQGHFSTATAAVLYNMALRFQALKESLTTSRKAYRLGRSIGELQKLYSMGVMQTIAWHWKQQWQWARKSQGIEDNSDVHKNGDEDHFHDSNVHDGRPTRLLVRHASSNIGWAPVVLVRQESSHEEMAAFDDRRVSAVASEHPNNSAVTSMSSSSPLRSVRRLSSCFSSSFLMPRVSEHKVSCFRDPSPPPMEPTWKVIGSIVKLMGLCGFWTADNVNFLAGAGVWDAYTMSTDNTNKSPTNQEDLMMAQRLEQRKSMQCSAGIIANRCYFTSAVAGWVLNGVAYWQFVKQRQKQRALVEHDQTEEESHQNPNDEERRADDEKQVTLLMALVKSCCDVLVFSNNPGIDLWSRYRGFKMHEGVHCIAGLISAGTVLYTTLPAAAALHSKP